MRTDRKKKKKEKNTHTIAYGKVSTGGRCVPYMLACIKCWLCVDDPILDAHPGFHFTYIKVWYCRFYVYVFHFVFFKTKYTFWPLFNVITIYCSIKYKNNFLLYCICQDTI